MKRFLAGVAVVSAVSLASGLEARILLGWSCSGWGETFCFEILDI